MFMCLGYLACSKLVEPLNERKAVPGVFPRSTGSYVQQIYISQTENMTELNVHMTLCSPVQ